MDGGRFGSTQSSIVYRLSSVSLQRALFALGSSLAQRRKLRAELLQAGEVVYGQEIVHIGQGGHHALGERLVIAAAEQWVEPDQPVAGALEARHLAPEQLREVYRQQLEVGAALWRTTRSEGAA